MIILKFKNTPPAFDPGVITFLWPIILSYVSVDVKNSFQKISQKSRHFQNDYFH